MRAPEMPDNGLPPARRRPLGIFTHEAAAGLFLTLAGEAEVWQESNRGCRKLLRRPRVGEFFGEIGIARRQVMAATAIEYGLKQNELAA
jgi:hypothetical protein